MGYNYIQFLIIFWAIATYIHSIYLQSIRKYQANFLISGLFHFWYKNTIIFDFWYLNYVHIFLSGKAKFLLKTHFILKQYVYILLICIFAWTPISTQKEVISSQNICICLKNFYLYQGMISKKFDTPISTENLQFTWN